MSEPRWSFTALELLDGRVFVIDHEACNGMSDLGGPPYPPGPTGPPRARRRVGGRRRHALNATRSGFVAVRLLDGRVLVTGGDNGWHGAYSSTKLFDPATGRWTGDRAAEHRAHGAGRRAPRRRPRPRRRRHVLRGLQGRGRLQLWTRCRRSVPSPRPNCTTRRPAAGPRPAASTTPATLGRLHAPGRPGARRRQASGPVSRLTPRCYDPAHWHLGHRGQRRSAARQRVGRARRRVPPGDRRDRRGRDAQPQRSTP